MITNPFIPNFPPTPESPTRLFKYLPPERSDILESLLIRFTPVLNTNDLFEVRRTFKALWGPKFISALLFHLKQTELNLEERAIRMLQESLGLQPEMAKALAEPLLINALGRNYKDEFARQVEDMILLGAELLNTPEQIGKILETISANQLILSLTEDPFNAVMWAHYSDISKGFLIEFDSSHEFFRLNHLTGKKRKLIQVNYFDEKIDEFVDDPFRAFFSGIIPLTQVRSVPTYWPSRGQTDGQAKDHCPRVLHPFPR